MIQTGSAISQVLVPTKLVSREPVILLEPTWPLVVLVPPVPVTATLPEAIRIVSSPRADLLDLRALEVGSVIISVGGSHDTG